MSDSEVYNLEWGEFYSSLGTAFGWFLEESDFIDVTLACDGQTFSVHKVVLSACSPYFRKMLKRNPCKHPIIILNEVKATILNLLVQFMYKGAAEVPHEQLKEFILTAQALQIRGLAENDTNADQITEDSKPNNHTTITKQSNKQSNVTTRKRRSNHRSWSAQEDAHEEVTEQVKQPRVEHVKDEDEVTEILDSKDFIEMAPPPTSSPSQDYSDVGQELPMDLQLSIDSELRTSSRGRHVCQFCSKGFPSPTKLRSHIEALHVVKPMDQWDECEWCGKKFKTASYLAKHIIVTHGIRKGDRKAQSHDTIPVLNTNSNSGFSSSTTDG